MRRSTPESAACPACQSPLAADEDCAHCAASFQSPPSARTLLRLGRFAKPYKLQLFIGFLLTLASTAASLVPPYMTMPIMDKVLIPYQNGTPIDTGLVSLYLGGLFGAALLAWVLSWGRTYILALVSERIGADLRTTTYEHLMQLSLELLRRQAHGRPDGTHQLRNRPHLRVFVAAFARFRQRRADDRDDGGHPRLHRSLAGAGHAAAAALHCLDDPHGP